MYRLLLCSLLLSGVACSSFRATPQLETDRPHILVILADDLGYKDVGYHGSEIQTPNIDKLAATGVRMNQFYVQSFCSPTRSSLMTGRYPIRQGLQVGVIPPPAQFGLPLNERTLPEALKEVGYQTYIVGKWHLGLFQKDYLPNQRGFDYHYGHYLGMIDYFTHERKGGLDWHRNGKTLHEEGYTTNLFADDAERIIAAHDPNTPMFFYMSCNAPHVPLQAPDEYINKYAHIKDMKRRVYAAMVDCMDVAIGRILDALRNRGMLDNTLILFCSDNGGPINNGSSNGPLREGKGSLYEGGVRVPAVAVWPGRLKARLVIHEPMHIVDWYPTLLKQAGASLRQPLPLDGLDVWPTLTEGKPSPHIEILHNLEPDRGAIRRGDWKLVVTKPSKRHQIQVELVELFNIANDALEKNNLAAEYPDKVQELMARLDYYAEQAVTSLHDTAPKPTEEQKFAKIWGEFE